VAEHAAALAHQFEDAEQQREAATLGMWVFLITEIMFFGGLFTGYAVYRYAYFEGFAEASRRLSVVLGAINTAVLICSSLTMALAVRGAQLGRRKGLIGFLLATILLGSLFLGIKAVEYSHKLHEGLLPGTGFTFPGPLAPAAEIFFSLYFTMTGLHALHMVIGIGLLALLVVQAWRGRFSQEYYAPVELIGLYWHFVDIVWIYLFPLLYLVSRAR
jgi:cytochrome c oxidase subunit 3